MGRFDKYITKSVENIKEKKKKVETKSDIWETIKNESPLIKYSILLGNIFFRLSIIKNLTINLTRKIFSKTEGYKIGKLEFEENVAKSIFGFLYFIIFLFILFLNSPQMAFLILIIGLTVAYFNYNTIRQNILSESFINIEILSDEVLSLVSWIILLLAAGMNLSLALNYYIKEEKGKLRDIIEREMNKVISGKLSLDVVLSNLAINLPRQDLKEIFTLILQSQKLGVPIKDSVETYLEHYQEKLLANAEKRGASANQKATLMLTAEVFLLMLFFLIGLLSTFLTSGLF